MKPSQILAGRKRGRVRMEPPRLPKGLMKALLLTFFVPVFAFAQDIPVLRGGSGVAVTSSSDSRPDLVVVFNRPIVVLRGSLYGRSPSERVRMNEQRISEAIAQEKTKELTTRQVAEGTEIELDGNLIMTITPGDVDQLAGDTIDVVVQKTLQRLRFALDSVQEQHSIRYLLRSAAKALVATVIYAAFIWAGRKMRIGLWKLVGQGRKSMSKTLGHSGSSLLPQLQVVYQWAVRILHWVLVIVATYIWFTFCLRQFPYTAPWGEALGGYLISMLRMLGQSVIASLPNLIIAVIIVVVTRLVTKLVRMFFNNVRERRISVTWLDPDNARPTGRIVTFIIWAFAMVMMYPYLPGSDSAAFKGVGVFLGLLVSLGGTGVISQVMGGFVLMYTRTLKVGEYVHIGEHEGTVESIGFMSTRLRSRKNEVINIPNALLMGIVTTNYSRLAEKQGVMASTTVTIGYDAPWRQVHAMLLRAAGKTPGLRRPPEPFVWQRSLSDFYVEYELNVNLQDPEQRLPVLSALCANIQDEFNEHGVQILSPHFMVNPPEKVWVPRKRWHEPPAKQDGGE